MDEFSTLKAMGRGWARVYARTGDYGALLLSTRCRAFVANRRRPHSRQLHDFNRSDFFCGYIRPAGRLPA